MKRMSIAILGAAATALALPAAAQNNALSSVYIGGSVGQSKARDACDNIPGTGLSCDDKDTAWRLLGGYQFNRYFAAEIGYHDLGKVEASGLGANADVKANAWELVGIGKWPIGNQFGVYGKLGGYRGETKLNTNFGVSGKETNTDWTYGAGVEWDPLRNLGVRLEWQRYNQMGGDDVGGESDVDVVSLGAVWRFQ